MSHFDIICLGYSAADYLGIVPQHPRIDSKVEMIEFSRQGGGPAATAAVTCARLGAKTAFVGNTGDDDLADFTLSCFEAEGVDASRVRRCSGTKSQFAFIMVDQSTGKRTIIWTRSDIPALSLSETDEPFFKSCKVLHLDRHEIDAGMQAAKWVRESGGIVSLDAGTYDPRLRLLLPLVDVLIASRGFAVEATGEDDQTKAARGLLEGRRVAGVTCGEDGSYFASQDGEFHVPAFEVDVVDTTGAGDVFHGAFAYGLSKDWDFRRCARFASAVASIKCTKLGGRAGIPTRDEADLFLAER